MRINFAWLVLVFVPVALAGCTKDNPIYCDQNTPCMSAVRSYCDLDGTLGGVANRCIDTGDGGRDASIDAGCTLSSCSAAAPICEVAAGMCRACSTDNECLTRGGTTPRCGTGTVAGTCVECATATAATDCTSAARPVCGAATGICRGCTQDSECGSFVCDEPTGMCAPPDTVVYATMTGTDGPTCGTQGSPCRTVTTSLALVTPTKRIIHLGAGTYTEAGSVGVSNKTVVIVGKGATIKPGVVSASVFLVGDGGNLTLEGVTVSDAAGSGSPRGISCTGMAGTPVVRLIEVLVTMNAGRGIDATDCMLSVERSTISRNQGGGIALSGSMYMVQNSFIVNNGSTSSSVGGMRVQDASVGTMTFTSVSQNTSTGAATAGVGCIGNVPTPRYRNNIVYGNLNAFNVAGCEWEFSDVQSNVLPPGGNNINEAPMFVDAAAGNYHLMAASPCKDKADPVGAPMMDFDRDLRPQGTAPEMGADELRP